MPQKVEYPPIYPLLIEVLRRDFPLLKYSLTKSQERDEFVYNGGQQSVIDKLELALKSQQKKNVGGNT